MHPNLFDIPFIEGLTVHTYGVMLAIGFLAGASFCVHQARRYGEDPQRVLDLCFYILIAAILGSRLYYVLIEWPYYAAHPLQILNFTRGGLVFYGGAIGAILTAIFFMRRWKLPIWRTCDLMAPAVPLGIFFGRIGCFSAGCCYGRPTDVPWAVVFRDPAAIADHGIPLHPTQLYASLDGLILFVALVLYQPYKRFDGQVFSAFLIGYAILRYAVEEPFRAGDRGAAVEGISVSVATGVPVMLAGLALMIFLGYRARAARLAEQA
ncbi:MAG: prolipoprotein diacylglyceryl transferase [Myxococcota bacterium]